MRLLFVQPPIRDFYRTQFREYPLGLLSLAAHAERAGHCALLLDARLCRKPLAAPLPAELSPLQAVYTKKRGLYLRYQHFGMDFAAIAAAATALKPDAVCLNAMFTPYVSEVIETARALEGSLPHVPIIVGGHHATADPASLLASGTIDTIIRGEGEEALPTLLSASKQPALDPPLTAAPYLVADLDTLPCPARHLIDPQRYLYRGKPYTMLLTSRGCPHACAFCSVHAVCGSQHRTRSIEALLAEIDECVHRHDIRVFDLQDDNLLFRTERIKVLLEQICRRYEGMELEWMASNGLNPARIDEELLALMKRAGFRKLDLALGTGDVSARQGLGRPETLADYERTLRLATEMGLSVTTYIILGLPFQPLCEMRATIAYLQDLPTLIAPSIFYNVPGMPIFEKAKRYEYVPAHVARRSSAFNCFGDDFSREDIVDLFAEIRRRNLSLRN